MKRRTGPLVLTLMAAVAMLTGEAQQQARILNFDADGVVKPPAIDVRFPVLIADNGEYTDL